MTDGQRYLINYSKDYLNPKYTTEICILLWYHAYHCGKKVMDEVVVVT